MPKSYKQFLKVSNGWWLEGTDEPIRLLGVEEIQPLVKTHGSLVGACTEYDDLVDDDDPANLPNSHLKTAIAISEDSDGFYLLNPKIEIEPGEYQCCFFANWIPGAEAKGTFGNLMREKFEAFVAARSAGPRINLRKPPDVYIQDPQVFITELDRLNYFEFCDEATFTAIREDFLKRASRRVSSLEPGADAGHALFDARCGRVVELQIEKVAEQRAAYAYLQLRPLLAGCGVELGALEEIVSDKSYAARLEGIEHEFFRLRKGKPAKQGGEYPINAARYVAYGLATLVNKVLAAQSSAFRIATLEALAGHKEDADGRVVSDMRLKFVLLDDPLSYLLMWSPLLMYAKPMRPDVW